MTEDWRGLHLIRSPRREAPEALRETDAVPQRPSAPGFCAVPGCGRGLKLPNSAGVCRTHMHNRKFCTCAPCAAKRGRGGA